MGGLPPRFLPFSDGPRLISLQREELGVRREDLGDRCFKLSGLFDPLADRIDPVRGNLLDVLLSIQHEGERPGWVTLAVGAMAGRLATSRMGQRQRSWEAGWGELHMIEKLLDAATQAGGLGALGRTVRRIHTGCNYTTRISKVN
jgi:hypothetical protein